MFDSFKKWIQTTVDTTNNVLTNQQQNQNLPTTQHLINNERKFINSNNNNNNNRLLNSSNTYLSSNSENNYQLYKNESKNDLYKNNRLRLSNSQLQSINLSQQQQQQQQYNVSKTQPSTPQATQVNFPKSVSVPHSPALVEQSLDLSHLSKEEQAHIAAVLERAKIDECESKSRKQSLTDTNELRKKSITNNNDKDLIMVVNNKIENETTTVINNNTNNNSLYNKTSSIIYDSCELCNLKIDNNKKKLYICEKCNKKFCFNCKSPSINNEKCKILCKFCYKIDDDNNLKGHLKQTQSPAALKATKQEIFNALVLKANQNPVVNNNNNNNNDNDNNNINENIMTTNTIIYTKPNKINKVSNCDEYYPKTEDIPYIHHHHHHHRRKIDNDIDKFKSINNINNNNQKENNNNNNDIFSNLDSSYGISNTTYSHADDETAFIFYAEREIANLEKTIQLKNIENKRLIDNTSNIINITNNNNNNNNKIHIKEIQDNQLVSSIENDSDEDIHHEEIIYNKDAKLVASQPTIKLNEISDNKNIENDDTNSKKIKRKLPPPPSEPIINERKKSPEPIQTNIKLENVTEWLNRSFDQNEFKQLNNGNINNKQKKIQQITLIEQKNLLDDRQLSDDDKYLDDIIEINLSNSIINHKQSNGKTKIAIPNQQQQQQQQQIIKHSQSPTYYNEQKKSSNNIVDENFCQKIDNVNTKQNIHDESIQRIYLYKDPKDQPDSLGMKISARQRLTDIKNDLAALVTSIIPDGLIQRFDVPIKIGDEIMEINGISLRNKTDDDIKKILNNSCETNNGEIEIVIRKINKKNNVDSNYFCSDLTVKNNYDQNFDELQSVVSSIGTLDPNRSSPSARSSITSSPVSSEMANNNQNLYMRLNEMSREQTSKRINSNLNKKIYSENERRIQQQQQTKYDDKLIKLQDDFKNKTQFDQSINSEYNKPLLKISAPPESDIPDYEENIFLNSSISNSIRTSDRRKSNQSTSSSRKSSNQNENSIDDRDQSNIYLTTTHRTSSIRSRSIGGSSTSTIINIKESQQDNLSSVTSIDDMKKLNSPISSRKTSINESQKSQSNLKTQTTETQIDQPNDSSNKSSLSISKNLNKSSNKLSIDENNKHMLQSASMSSIGSVRKCSNESCSADVESDNFSKYFPSSRENSRRNSRENSAKNSITFSNKSSIVNDLNEKTTDSTIKKNLIENEKTSDKKSKSRLSFKFGKRSSSVTNKAVDNLEARKLERSNSIKNPSAPYGEIQLQIGHSEKDEQINVKILRARNLLPKDANGFSDPFVKVYLLPGRDQDNKRRTKPILKNLNPEWNYTVVYPNVHKEELKLKTLEFTLWDYDRFKSNDFLGKVSIDLSDSKYLDDKPRWYALIGLDNNNNNLQSKTLDNKSRKKSHQSTNAK